MIIQDDHSFDNLADPKLETKYDNSLNVGDRTLANFDHDAYLKDIGHEAMPNSALNVKYDGKSGEFKVDTRGDLAAAQREVTQLDTRLKRAEESLKKYPENETYKKDVDSFKKQADMAGKSAQRELTVAKSEIEAHQKAFHTAHDEHLRGLFEKRQNLQEVLEGVEHKNPDFSKLGDHVIEVKLGKDTHLIDRNGIGGKGAGGLSAEEFDKVTKAASQQVDRHFDAAESAHSKAAAHMEERYKAKIDEVAKLQKSVKEKTGAAEWSKTHVEKATAPGRGVFKATSENIGKNFSKAGGAWGKTKVGIGAIGVVDGARRVIKGLAGSNDPEKGDSRMGNLVVGIGEIGLGAFVAQHGGGKVR